MQLTKEDVLRFAPRANEAYVNALVEGWPELEQGGINTPLRLAHFMAQTAHETGGFSIIREHTGWKPEQMCALWPHRFRSKLDPRILLCKGDPQRLANLAYGGNHDLAVKLGNTVEADDGWAYRGGGFLQLTGRAAYVEAGNAIGIDLESAPELIEDPAVSLAAALWVWARHDLGRFADRSYGRAVGNAINRGNPFSSKDPIGFKSRQQWTERALAVFGARAPASDELALGAHGAKIGQLQEQLRELGYGVGDVDKVFGPALARAVAAFKLDYRRSQGGVLEPEEIAGPATQAALEAAQPVVPSPERLYASERDLAAKGSTEIAAGRRAKSAGQGLLYLGAFEGARQTGALDGAMAGLSQVTALKTTMVPALEALQWATRNIFWVLVIAGGVWFWTKGRQIIAARLAAHRFGFNMWR